MKEINYKEMRFNPFNLIGGEWMLESGRLFVTFSLEKILLPKGEKCGVAMAASRK